MFLVRRTETNERGYRGHRDTVYATREVGNMTEFLTYDKKNKAWTWEACTNFEPEMK